MALDAVIFECNASHLSADERAISDLVAALRQRNIQVFATGTDAHRIQEISGTSSVSNIQLGDDKHCPRQLVDHLKSLKLSPAQAAMVTDRVQMAHVAKLAGVVCIALQG